MNDTRYKNLYDALTSHIDYCNFIETYGEDNVNFENTNFDLLQTIYGAFSLTLLIDDYFVVQNNTINCKLIPNVVQQLIEKIAVYNGHGYTVGDLMYKDEYTVLEKVRNKLAHGDFIIRNGEIVFEENKLEGRIRVDKFLSFITTFETEAPQYTLSNPYTKVFNKTENLNRARKITNQKDIDYLCNNLYRVEMTDTPIFPKTRDSNYIQIINMFYDTLKKKLITLSAKELDEYIKKNIPILKKYGIHMKYSIQNVKKLSYYENIKEKYMDMADVYERLSINEQINRINNLVYILGNGRYQKLDIKKGLQLNRFLIQELKKHPEYSLKELVTENNEIWHIVLYHMDSAVLSSYLVGFNALYEYGLEKGLTQKGNYNIASIYEGKSLDFSLLNIDELDDPNMLIEHTFTKYLTDPYEYEIKAIAKADKLIQSKKNKLDEYTKKCRNQTEEKIRKFQQEIEEAELDKLELQMDIVELKEFASNFDLNKYTRNINIITHIRNAISHGNVYVDSYATDIRDTDIIFRDYLDGNLVYEKKIKIKDFVYLFHSSNIKEVYSFITNNIEDKSLIDENYYGKVMLRSVLREITEMEKTIPLRKSIKH